MKLDTVMEGHIVGVVMGQTLSLATVVHFFES